MRFIVEMASINLTANHYKSHRIQQEWFYFNPLLLFLSLIKLKLFRKWSFKSLSTYYSSITIFSRVSWLSSNFDNSEEIFSSSSEKLLDRQETQAMRLEKDIKITWIYFIQCDSRIKVNTNLIARKFMKIIKRYQKILSRKNSSL